MPLFYEFQPFSETINRTNCEELTVAHDPYIFIAAGKVNEEQSVLGKYDVPWHPSKKVICRI